MTVIEVRTFENIFTSGQSGIYQRYPYTIEVSDTPDFNFFLRHTCERFSKKRERRRNWVKSAIPGTSEIESPFPEQDVRVLSFCHTAYPISRVYPPTVYPCRSGWRKRTYESRSTYLNEKYSVYHVILVVFPSIR